MTRKAIQKAFNAAVTAGPGSTVQLSAGHFYTNNIVVNGFDGNLQGRRRGQDLHRLSARPVSKRHVS